MARTSTATAVGIGNNSGWGSGIVVARNNAGFRFRSVDLSTAIDFSSDENMITYFTDEEEGLPSVAGDDENTFVAIAANNTLGSAPQFLSSGRLLRSMRLDLGGGPGAVLMSARCSGRILDRFAAAAAWLADGSDDWGPASPR